AGHRLIAFLDDIDDYCSAARIDAALEDLFRRGVQVVATCRTGPEYDVFESNISPTLRELMKIVPVTKLTPKEVNIFHDPRLADNVDWHEFDGNVGSLFLPLSRMRDRYRILCESQRDSDRLSVQILHALKVLYLSGNRENKSTYDRDKLRD